MNTRYILLSSILLGLIFFSTACKTNSLKQTVKKEKDQIVSQIWKDQLGRFYHLADDQSLNKFEPNGELLHSFVHGSFYGITKVDLTDLYKISLFYREQQMIVILDNTLSVIGEIDLNSLEDRYIRTFCNSGEGGYWVYDENKQQLLEIDNEINVLTESYPLYQEGIIDFLASDIKRNHDKLVMTSGDGQILLFDQYATFTKKLKSIQFHHFEMLDDMLLLINEGRFYLYDLLNFVTIPVFDDMPEEIQAYSIDLQKREIILYDSTNPFRELKPIAIK